MLIDGLTTGFLNDRLAFSQMTHHSKFSDTIATKRLKASEGPSVPRRAIDPRAPEIIAPRESIEDAKNFTLNELHTDAEEDAATMALERLEEAPSNKYTFRQNSTERITSVQSVIQRCRIDEGYGNS